MTLFKSLLQTFRLTSISYHTTAACNALSSFLDTASGSQCHETRKFVESEETLLSVFECFLTRFKEIKPKPMKQVLESVTVIIARLRHQTRCDTLQLKLLDAILPGILLGEPRSRVKASIIALETFLQKKAFSSVELIPLLETWLVQNPDRWPTTLQEQCRESSIDAPQLLQRPPEAASTVESKEAALQILILGLLNRSKSLELAPSSGSVMAKFFQKLEAPVDSTLSGEEKERLAFAWVKPMKSFLLRNLDDLEKFSNYILLQLFEASTSGFRCFLWTLPLKSLFTGDMSNALPDELTILFSSLQLGKKIGLVHEDRKCNSVFTRTWLTSLDYFTKVQKPGDQPLILKSEYIGQFLFHHDFNIKMAALSLLVIAPTTTKPLSSTAIRVVLKSLPSLHAESDPRTRGEILSMVRGLVVRLKSGILANIENPVEPRTTLSKKQPIVYIRDDNETRSSLENYLSFLMADLRTNASYHQHIMSLRTLYLLIESGLDDRFIGTLSSKPEHLQIRWKLHTEIFGQRLLRLLVDLLMDPYDEVRIAALNLLKLFPRPVLLKTAGRGEERPELLVALSKAEILASNTSRADHADTVALLYHLMFCTAEAKCLPDVDWWHTKRGVVELILSKLEGKLSSSEGLFTSSLRDAPLHGYLSALRYEFANICRL